MLGQQPDTAMTVSMLGQRQRCCLHYLPAEKFRLVQQQPPIIATASIADQQPPMTLAGLNGGTTPFYLRYCIQC
jgi:hypothetical protein